MKISFVLTGSGHRPVGGFKVIYEYANRLAADGHIITLVHPQIANAKIWHPKIFAAIGLFWWRKFRAAYLPDRWFQLHPKVICKWVFTPRGKDIPDGDFVFATGWNTAKFVADLPDRCGDRLYFIQHFETWAVKKPDVVLETWNLDLHKIVIASWLRDIAKEMGQTACLVPNGLDFEAFGVDQEIRSRQPASILFLNHWRPYKGTPDAVEAVEAVVKRHPGAKVRAFGVSPRPEYFPDYVEYFQNPSQTFLRQLYNDSAIFLAPSHSEGWGLTACEAMICGCAVVATNVGGHREFAVAGHNALMVEPNQPEEMAEAALQLVDNSALRFAISENGQSSMAEFTWEKSYSKLLNVLISRSSSRADAKRSGY